MFTYTHVLSVIAPPQRHEEEVKAATEEKIENKEAVSETKEKAEIIPFSKVRTGKTVQVLL